MPCASSIEEAIALAEERWPGYTFTVKNSEEACGPCPLPGCGAAAEDGFLIFSSGFYYCRPGEHEGWLDEHKKLELTPDQILLRKHEAKLRQQDRKHAEFERRIAALERMASCNDHELYHAEACHKEWFWAWAEQNGLRPETVTKYKIGYCARCPTDHEGRSSYTFPIWRKDGPLWSIRHRLIGEDRDKYRPHMAGLGNQLVNAQKLRDWDDYVVIVEGTKKTRVIEQYNIPVAGILGSNAFEIRWLKWFHPAAHIVLALDPDANEQAHRLAVRMKDEGRIARVASFARKPDDMFVAGCTRKEWLTYIQCARKVA